MQRITQALPAVPVGLKIVKIPVDRHKLARRRWRGEAEDGTDFGFDVAEALAHGDCFFASESAAYVIEQSPEPCFLIALGAAPDAARIGWMIGNLHFKAAFADDGILVPDDAAVRQMLDRESIHYHPVSRVFQPTRCGGHSHSHDHEHSHEHSHAH